MKESFGGTFMLWLFMFFFVIYITVLCVALQFAKTYRVKNKIVNIVEQEKYNIYSKPDSITKEVEAYLDNVPYTTSVPGLQTYCENKAKDDAKAYYWIKNGVCITTKIPEDEAKGSTYYEVEVYFTIQLPFLLKNGITIPIKGETTRIFID